MGIENGLRGETGLVDAVVDVVVGPFVGLVDCLAQVVGQEGHVLVFVGEQVVEFGVEHADYLAGFVADDPALLDVVQRRYREAPFVFRVHFEIDVAQVCKFWVDGVGRHVLAGELFVFGCEAPAWEVVRWVR